VPSGRGPGADRHCRDVAVAGIVAGMGAWRSRSVGLALVAALAVAACARGAPSTGSSPSARPATSGSPVATSAAGDGPLVVDTDLGADDIVAIALLVASDADIRAVTVAGTGLVHCAFGVGHLEMLLHRLGAPDIPVGCGRETAEPPAVPMPGPWRSAADNAYGLTLAPTRPARTEPAPAAIAGPSGPRSRRSRSSSSGRGRTSATRSATIRR